MPNLQITIDEEEHTIEHHEMDIVRPVDKAGNSIKLQLFEGVHYGVAYSPRVLRQIKTVQLREDDIYFPSYLRTGTHWTFEMVSMLLNGKAETIKKFKGKHQLEFMTCEQLSCLPSPRVINTHMKLSLAPAQLREKKCKIIFNLRDPKDVVVSLYVAISESGELLDYKGSFEDFLHLFYEGKGLSQSGTSTVGFHWPPRNDQLCHDIAEKCKFSNMKVDKDNYSMKVNGKNILFRKGIVGDWKNWFTDEMLEDYYRVYDEKMAGSRFYERYARDT